jgi:hypothetical protein
MDNNIKLNINFIFTFVINIYKRMDINILKNIFKENILKYDFYDIINDTPNLESDNSYDYKFNVKSIIGSKIYFLVDDESKKTRDFKILDLDRLNIHALSEVHGYYILFNKLEELKDTNPIFDKQLGWSYLIKNFKILINEDIENISNKEIIKSIIDYYKNNQIIYLEMESISSLYQDESDTDSENKNEYKIFPQEDESKIYSYKIKNIKEQLKEYREDLFKTFYYNLNKKN